MLVHVTLALHMYIACTLPFRWFLVPYPGVRQLLHEEAKWRKRSVPKTGESMLGMQEPTDLRRSFISSMGSFDRNW